MSRKTQFFPDEIMYLKKYFRKYPFRHIAEHINSRRKKRISESVLRKKAYEFNLQKKKRETVWSEFETNYLRENFRAKGNIEIAAFLNLFENRSRNFNRDNVDQKLRKMKLKRTADETQVILARYVKNGVFSKAEMFAVPVRRYPEEKKIIKKVGKRLFYFIKKDGRIQPLNKVIFEQVNGPVPAGHRLYFADGNTLNCSISNIIMLPKQRIIYRNGITTKLKCAVPAVTEEEMLNPFGTINKQTKHFYYD